MERSRPEPTARRTRLPLPPPVAVGFLLAIVTVGIMALVMEGAMRSRAIVATRLVQSGEVVQRLERIDALVRTAESGQRGFLLVGRDSYLGDYDAALAQLPVELAALRTLLAGTPDKLDPLTALESGLREKQAELDQTLKQARAGDRDGALALVATDRGRMVMDRVKTQLDDRTKRANNDAALKSAGETLRTNASGVEESVYQVRNQSGQDPLNFPIKVNNRLANLLAMSERGDDNAPPTRCGPCRGWPCPPR